MNTEQLETAHMPFLEHLQELRTCFIHILSGVFVMSIASFAWSKGLFGILTAPLFEHFDGTQLIGTGPSEAFLIRLKVSLVAGIVLSCPYSFYQLWKFIAPGLYDEERQMALPFVALTTACFLIGITFCFTMILPYAFQFFSGEYDTLNISPTIRIGEYFSFVIKLLLVFGVTFELPVLSYFLARLGLLKSGWLVNQGRYAVVVIFVIAAILTPPDIITQVLLALPLILLYGICIGITYWVEANKAKEEAETTNQ